MKERLLYVDLMKGITIFLVVMGHLIQVNTIESAYHPIFSIIYSFHMPLFMFISGYIGQKSFTLKSFNDVKIQMFKKGIALILPYFAWSFLVENFFFANKLPQHLDIQFVGLWENWNHLWFLWYLFVIYVFYTLHQIIVGLWFQKQNLLLDILVFGFIISMLFLLKYLNVYFPIDIDSFVLYFIFFFGGTIVSSYPAISNLMLNKYIFFIALLGFLILVGYYNFLDLGLKNKLTKISVSIFAIISLYNITRQNSWDSLFTKRIQFWGVNSLVIYVTHFGLLKIFYGNTQIHEIGYFYLVLLLSTIAILLIETSILIKRFFSFSPIMNLILYGEIVKKTKNK
jgi:fucose 4-O-acetylase-like acetyltransferase